MSFVGVLNSRMNSFQLGHDTTQIAKKMTKDTKDISHFDNSSQHPRQGSTCVRRTSTEEELGINQSIKCSFFWSSYKKKMFVNKLGSL